jgi:hypothetical protein
MAANRDSGDDGILTGMLLTPLIAAALLCTALASAAVPGAEDADGLPPGWAIEPPFSLSRNPHALPPVAALVRARYNLLSLSILTSAVLLGHVCASRWLEERYVAAAASGIVSSTGTSGTPPVQANGNGNGATAATEGERRSVPRSEGLRGLYFILFTLSVSAAALIFRLVLERLGTGFWQRACHFVHSIDL